MKQMKKSGARAIGFVLALWALWLMTGCAGTEVGNPETDNATTTTDVATFGSDGELEAYLKEQYAQSVTRTYYTSGDGASAPAVSPAENSTAGDAQDSKHSDTNLQEAGVDESDKVKTDGTHLFIASNQTIYIVSAADPMTQLAAEPIGGLIDSLYLYSGKLVVLYTPANATGDPWLGYGAIPANRVGMPYWIPVHIKQGVAIYDVSNPQEPARLKAYEFDGELVSSRLIDGRLHIVQQYLPALPPLDLWYNGSSEDLRNRIKANEAKLAAISLAQMIPHYTVANDPAQPARPTVASDHLYYPLSEDCGGTITTVVTIDLNAEALPFTSVGMVADAHIIYASTQALYTATHKYTSDTNSERATIYKYDLTGEAVRCVAGGRVPGWILNQFSLGEYQGVLRVATTTGHVGWGENNARNHVFCLQADGTDLKTVGRLENLAPGEQIYAARFMAQRGYLVTYVKIDPLFTLDLSDPAAPKVVGQLKVPGYSDYIHPWGDDYLITIGKDARLVEQDNMAWYQGVQLSIFDVRDFANPVLLHKALVGDRGTESEALYNHKAFTFWPARNLLAIPIHLYEHLTPPPADQPWSYGSQTFTGLYVYQVTTDAGFDLIGRISTPSDANPNDYSSWTRGVFVEDQVFAITPTAARSAEIDNIEETIETLLFAP